ncbi:MAG: type II toxin-antitoxin system RelE/ParE family toxin [Alphaproteobacteria bacterium]|nr:type II toxin-antitoxin system RelE/ParE family toxin [Alphaproteobacteria bacterium]
MADYRLSKAAQIDLIEIAHYGGDQYGPKQSETYRDKLSQRLEDISAAPMQFPAVEHVQPGIRRAVCGAHQVYFHLVDGEVEIVRVLGRQDLAVAF